MDKDNRMLTEYSLEEMACPKCGYKHSIRKYKRINVTEKEGLRQDILKNRIFAFRCEKCGLNAPLTYECHYYDPGKKYQIFLAPELDEKAMQAMKELEEKTTGTKRVVDNINDLKEKIMIRENHMDDRVVELLKIMVISQLKKEMKDDTLMNILFDYNGGDLFFIVFFEKKGIGRLPIALDQYRQIENQYRMGILDHSVDAFMKVDLEWAGKVAFR